MGKTALVLMTIILMFTAASCSVADEGREPTAVVCFSTGEDEGRSLTRSVEELDESRFYWYYTAKKTDSTGLRTGETAVETIVGKSGADDEKGLVNPKDGKPWPIGAFSYGKWTFTLSAYDKPKSDRDAVLVYRGSAENTVINRVSSTVAVSVESQTGQSGKGTLVIPPYGTVGIVTDGGAVCRPVGIMEYCSYRKLSEDGTYGPWSEKIDIADSDASAEIPLDSGVYEVRLSFQDKADQKDDSHIIYAEEIIYVSIRASLRTSIGGNVEQNTGAAWFSAGNMLSVTFIDYKNSSVWSCLVPKNTKFSDSVVKAGITGNPAYSGLVFAGWAENPAYREGTEVTRDDALITKDTVFVSVWTTEKNR